MAIVRQATAVQINLTELRDCPIVPAHFETTSIVV